MENEPIREVASSLLCADKEESCGIKAILFDLGNVLIDFDHRQAALSLSFFTDKSAEEIYDLFFDSPLTALFEEGKITPLQFFAEVRSALDLEINYHQFVPIWNEIFFFSEKNLGVYQLASQLKKNHKFTVLSNINILHLEYIQRTFPLLSGLPILTSYEAGVRKPDPAIYQKALQMLGTAAQDVFYADDRAELVAGANVLGIRGHVFKDVEGLKKDLVLAGVNIS